MLLAVLAWTAFFDVYEKRLKKKGGRSTAKSGCHGTADAKTGPSALPPLSLSFSFSLSHSHTHTRTHTVVGYFKHHKTVIWVLHFWPLWLWVQMAKREWGIRGWQGWRLGLKCGAIRRGYNGNTTKSASRKGQGSHLLSRPPLPC